LKIVGPEKKTSEKALIPLPPTGFALLFCAKDWGGAISSAGQARCGVCRGNVNCAECKGWKKYVTALHGA